MRKIVVFYAWQSDTPQRFNRHLIRTALEVATRRINEDPKLDIELSVDSDTEGVPGQPPVTDTILKKIAACDIFAPDLTFVANTDGGKFVPNPNVLVEYGYALRAKTHAAMMPIMNTSFGPPENLPFDMGHLRHPIQYYLSPAAKNAERRTARQQLCEKIEKALRLTLAATAEQARMDDLFKEMQPVRPPAFFYAAEEVLATAGFPEEHQYRAIFTRAAYIRLFPTYANQQRVTLAQLSRVFQMRHPCPMSMTIGGIPDRNKFGPIIYDPLGQNTIVGLTQGLENGELWGLNGQLFTKIPSENPLQKTKEPITIFPMISFEKLFCRVLPNYVKISEELGLRPPFTVELGVCGLSGVHLTVPGGPFGNGSIEGPVLKDDYVNRYSLMTVNDAAIGALLRDYFEGLYDLAALSRADVLMNDFVAAHGLLPR